MSLFHYSPKITWLHRDTRRSQSSQWARDDSNGDKTCREAPVDHFKKAKIDFTLRRGEKDQRPYEETKLWLLNLLLQNKQARFPCFELECSFLSLLAILPMVISHLFGAISIYSYWWTTTASPLRPKLVTALRHQLLQLCAGQYFLPLMHLVHDNLGKQMNAEGKQEWHFADPQLMQHMFGEHIRGNQTIFQGA